MNENDEEDGLDTESENDLEASMAKGKVLEKAFGPAAEDFGEEFRDAGKDIAVTAKRTTRVILLTLNGMVWGIEKVIDWITAEVDKRLENVPESERVKPDLQIAGPTIEAMRFTGGNPELSNLFANLLATAMDSNTVQAAHPAFVEIIKQLCPDEARIISYMVNINGVIPVIDMTSLEPEEPHKSHRAVWLNYSHVAKDAGCENPEHSMSFLDNLCRLELCRVRKDGYLIPPQMYEALEQSDNVKRFKEGEEKHGHEVRIERHHLMLTVFGHQFAEACVIRKL